jgi:hypothetical protein
MSRTVHFANCIKTKLSASFQISLFSIDISDRKDAQLLLKQRVQDEAAKNREKDHVLIRQSRLAAMGK